METATQQQQAWTILSLIEWSTQYLSDRQFEDARLTVELLLCHVLQCKRIDVYLKFDNLLTAEQLATFKQLFKRRLNHEPLQYITGETEFMGLRFMVDPRVLIPRPETEVLVEQVIDYNKSKPNTHLKILEIGTGSGNIAITLAKHLPGCILSTCEIDAGALELARENARRHGVEQQIAWLNLDILQDIPTLSTQRFDVIVTNPPYISREEFQNLQPEVRDFEPSIATTDDEDGLRFYRRIADIGGKLLEKGGAIFMEIAYNQGKAVPALFVQSEYRLVEVVKDYSGNDRVVKAGLR
ncbi:MAG: peptide chain release factor N(5)-glutamine methyltransferase [Ignavibacteriae bacterium]|nr:peptide chain release factor N(5)-glutamine methyltransferase [Ignavibacteria bacterium]MBI3365315.1 peptide chain release factor N(5)-glutamine methyltransferase [Ignavibacteriota bacterium]